MLSTPARRRDELCGPSSRWEPRVYNNTSRTLEVIGVAEEIERSGLYQPLRPRLYQVDREMQGSEMRQLSAAPDCVVGSVHAVTERGHF